MGKQQISNGTLLPLQALSQVTPAQVSSGIPADRRGFIPIGAYKGGVAFFDLDKLVNQPLALVEREHMLGVLDGREEDHDLLTLTLPVGAAIGAVVRDRLAVPQRQVWYLTAVELVAPADQGGRPALNWRCSLWPDRGTSPDQDGQAFHGTDLADAAGAGHTWCDEFHPQAPSLARGNKPQALRLPAGTRITGMAANTIAQATANMSCTLKLYGWVAGALVQ